MDKSITTIEIALWQKIAGKIQDAIIERWKIVKYAPDHVIFEAMNRKFKIEITEIKDGTTK